MLSISLVRKSAVDPWNKVVDITPDHSMKKSALLGLKAKHCDRKE